MYNLSQGRNQGKILGVAKLLGGHNLLSLVEMGLRYLTVYVRQVPCLPYH